MVTKILKAHLSEPIRGLEATVEVLDDNDQLDEETFAELFPFRATGDLPHEDEDDDAE
jgi:hypothetical protein